MGIYYVPRVVLVAQKLGRRTFDEEVEGSTSGRGVIKSPGSTQPFIPLEYVNRVPALMVVVKAGK